jgi:hypothetical protein
MSLMLETFWVRSGTPISESGVNGGYGLGSGYRLIKDTDTDRLQVKYFGLMLYSCLRYKLWLMGVQVDGPTNVFCDNEAVVKRTTTTKLESTLKKKHNTIAYHRVWEAQQAAGIVRIAKEDGETNLADILTKCLPGPGLRILSGYIM